MLKSYWVGWGGVGGPCDYCVSPSPKNWVLGIFSLGQDFWVRTLGTVGTGDSDLDLGLTESRAKNKKWPDDMGKKSKVK